jgi:hypothetical protein
MAERPSANLAHVAGLLFDSAATWWYRALGIEAGAAVLGGVIAWIAPTGQDAAMSTLVVVALLAAAYAMRLVAEGRQDTAQTMRRQAAFSEGLGWRIAPAQAEEWRRRAGNKLLRRADASPRDDDYYATAAEAGPKRLAEMTRESAFYTRHLWLSMRTILIVALGVVAIAVGATGYLALALPAPAGVAGVIAQVVATVVLLAIALDILGWVLRLGRQAHEIHQVEDGLDRAIEHAEPVLSDVVRLVAEYDCELVNSIPIHSTFFRWKHDDIRELWERLSAG